MGCLCLFLCVCVCVCVPVCVCVCLRERTKERTINEEKQREEGYICGSPQLLEKWHLMILSPIKFLIFTANRKCFEWRRVHKAALVEDKLFIPFSVILLHRKSYLCLEPFGLYVSVEWGGGVEYWFGLPSQILISPRPPTRREMALLKCVSCIFLKSLFSYSDPLIKAILWLSSK